MPESTAAIITALTNSGFISSPLRDNVFLPGEEFLNLLTFLGCSPNIHLHPDDGELFCYVRINAFTDKAVCLGYTSTVKPRCPACKKPLQNWLEIHHWQLANTQHHCHQCGTSSAMHKLKWRHECGFGQFSLAIAHIHPHEAVPAEKLLNILEQTCGFAWTYCYANN